MGLPLISHATFALQKHLEIVLKFFMRHMHKSYAYLCDTFVMDVIVYLR